MTGIFVSMSRRSRRHPVRAALALMVSAVAVAFAILYLWSRSQLHAHIHAAEQALARFDFTAARTHLAWCRQSQPAGASLIYLSARTARRAKDYAEAERLLGDCERLQVDPEALTLERTLIRVQQGDMTEITDRYLAALVKQNQLDAPFILEALAEGYMKNFRLPDAMRTLDQLLERQPNHLKALVWRGWVWKRLYEYGKAADDYRRAVEIQPDFDEARLRLGESLVDYLGKTQEALRLFEDLQRRWPQSSEVLLGLARCRRLLGQTQEALELVEVLLKQNPNDGHALTERGKLALAAGQIAEAEQWLRLAGNARPFDREVAYARYQCLERLGRAEDARKYKAQVDFLEADLNRLSQLVKMTVQRPNDPSIRCEVGVILARNGQEEEALHWFFLALSQDPHHKLSHRALAAHYQQKGDSANAAYHSALAK